MAEQLQLNRDDKESAAAWIWKDGKGGYEDVLNLPLAGEGNQGEKGKTAAQKLIASAQKPTDPQQSWNDNIATTAEVDITEVTAEATASTDYDTKNHTALVLWHGLTLTAAAKYPPPPQALKQMDRESDRVQGQE